jgi:membrane protein
MARDTLTRDTLIPVAAPRGLPGSALATRVGVALSRAFSSFWRHGNLFSAAAISFYALFSLLPLAILLLFGLQTIIPVQIVSRNIGRLFGGMSDTSIILRTISEAYAQQGSFGIIGLVPLVLAATGVFTSVQMALDRVWECRGRVFHFRFLLAILTMVLSLLIFLGMLLATIMVFRFIRTSEIGRLMGWPPTPPRGSTTALTISSVLAQFTIFWTAYRFLPNAYVRWRDTWPGALVATAVWHAIAYMLSWYVDRIADYATLYSQLQTIVALLGSVYALAASFLFGAEFVVQWTTAPPAARVSSAGAGPP